MEALLTVLTLLAGDRANRFKRHAGAQLGLSVALVVALTLTVGFALALGVYLVALKTGLGWALGIGLGLSLLATLLIAIFRRIEARQHRERQAEASSRDKLLVTQALLTSFGGAGAKSALVVGLAALALGLFGGKGKDTPPDKDDS